jgi:hypothetical protein
VRVVEHDPEGIPVVEQLAHQRLGLVMGAVGMRQTERSQSLQLLLDQRLGGPRELVHGLVDGGHRQLQSAPVGEKLLDASA